jgi:hypothetical protein
VAEDTKPFENEFIYEILNPGLNKQFFASSNLVGGIWPGKMEIYMNLGKNNVSKTGRMRWHTGSISDNKRENVVLL